MFVRGPDLDPRRTYTHDHCGVHEVHLFLSEPIYAQEGLVRIHLFENFVSLQRKSVTDVIGKSFSHE